jgi:hypothetical protein
MRDRVTKSTAAAVLLILLFTVPTMFGRGRIATQGAGYITGNVTSISSGRPVASVWVIMKQGGNEKGRSLTGDDGSYYIGNLGDGGYEILVTKGAGQTTNAVTLPQNKVFNIRINF